MQNVVPPENTAQPIGVDNAQPIENKPKSKKKVILLGVLAAVVLLLGSYTAWALFIRKDTKQPTATTASSQAEEVQQPAVNKSTFFFVNSFKQPKNESDPFLYSFKFLSPSDNKVREETLTTSQSFITSVADSNQSVQFTKAGDYFAYATGDEPGIGAPTPKPNSYKLHFGKWGTEATVVLADKEPADILDWKLTNDGKEIFFVQQVTDGNKNVKSVDLYKIDLATKKVASAGKLTRASDRTHSRLFEVEGDKSIRFYSSLAIGDGVYETRYNRSNQKLDYKKVIDGKLYEWGGFMQDSLSPDGTKLLYVASHTGIGKVIIYVMDLSNGTVQKLIDLSDKTLGHYGGYWSPDSKSALFNTSPFGGDAQERKGFKNQVFTMDVTSKTVQTIAENASPGGGYTANYPTWYTSNSWSNDGNIVTYILDKKLYFYDIKSGKILEKLTTALGEGGFDSQSSFGWLEQ